MECPCCSNWSLISEVDKCPLCGAPGMKSEINKLATEFVNKYLDLQFRPMREPRPVTDKIQ